MEMPSILEYLRNKTLLVTGGTGFLGKIFVEKILRAQPEVKKIYLLLRASGGKTIQERFQQEVIEKDLFNVLREKHGDGFGAFISEKVHVVAGDVSEENLGITDDSLVCGEIDSVVNIAATTKFDERYDVALKINTMGAKHVVDFSKKCPNLGMLLHVSTAYVAGERTGIIPEEPFKMGEALNGGLELLDIKSELNLAMTKLRELQLQGVKKREERIAMKKLGIERARHFGWPNTYVFTKSMGEMIVGQSRGELPVAIMRPTIISSTFAEPFPGWVEGSRTIDSFITAYAKGNLSFILGNPVLIVDVIPGDMVVNAMLGIMASTSSTHPNHQSDFIYHIGSSSRNPVEMELLNETTYKHMCLIKGKKNVRKAKFLTTKRRFDFQMKLSYKLPLLLLGLVDAALFNTLKDKLDHLNRKYNFMMRLADLYAPYTFFMGRFDDQNVGKMISGMEDNSYNPQEKKDFNFDTTNVNWEDYFMNIHIPGVLKYMAPSYSHSS